MSEQNTAQDWINDITDSSDDDDETESKSLFEENFRKMVDDGDVSDMALSTLENQVDRINDRDILSDAVDADDRDDAQEIYKQRVAEINKQEQDDSTDETDSVDGGSNEDDGVDEEDEGGERVESDGGSESNADAEESQEDESPTEEDAADSRGAEAGSGDTDDDLPDVDVSSLAPNSVSVSEAAEREKQRSLLVWGPEGSGKSHVCHSAPEPICYIDTEGKADELAEKFEDKRIHYFVAHDFKEASTALDQALDVLSEYAEHGVRGTLVVDSMTKMWEYAKVDYAKFAYQTEDLSDVNFQSELQGEKDWTKIKARHNEEFRDRILESDYHVVFAAGQTEDYEAVIQGDGKAWKPDGEKWNRYAVKEVVRLRRDGEGRTVGDLKKAAKTRYSFVGLEWPTWDSIYDSIDRIHEVEQSPGETDISDWSFDVVDGQPVGNSPDGSDGGDDDDE